MPKKIKTKKRSYYTSQAATTNQKTTLTYRRWFIQKQLTQNPSFFLKFKLPGYFTHEYEVSYLWRKKDRKKY